MARIVLVRHGETTWNREGRIQGWADSSLTERGRRQASATGRRLAAEYDADGVVASDLRRTRETATLLREAGLNAPTEHDRAWRERSFGEYRGLTRTVVAAEHPTYRADGSVVAIESVPGGESRAAFATRVREGFERLRDGLDDRETAVVVTHGGPIRAVLASVTDRDLASLATAFSPGNCGLTVLVVSDGEVAVDRRDDRAHLES